MSAGIIESGVILLHETLMRIDRILTEQTCVLYYLTLAGRGCQSCVMMAEDYTEFCYCLGVR